LVDNDIENRQYVNQGLKGGQQKKEKWIHHYLDTGVNKMGKSPTFPVLTNGIGGKRTHSFEKLMKEKKEGTGDRTTPKG